MYARQQNSSRLLSRLTGTTLPTLLLVGILSGLFSPSEAKAVAGYQSNELDASISYAMPTPQEQAKLNTCFTRGQCNQKNDSLVRRYPMRCEGSGNADCTGCYVLQNNVPVRTGDLVNGQCPVDASKPQQLRMYVSYKMLCPGNTPGDCDGGSMELNCRLTGIAAQDYNRTTIGNYERDCFTNGPYIHRATSIPGTSSCTASSPGRCQDMNPADYCTTQQYRDSCGNICGVGTKVCGAAVTYCPTGFYGDGTSCTPCPAGFYNSTAATGPTTLITGCQQCPTSPSDISNFAPGWTITSPIGSTSINNCMLTYSCNSGYTPSSSTNGPWNAGVSDYLPSTCAPAASPTPSSSPSPMPSPSVAACNISVTTGAITAATLTTPGAVAASATVVNGSGNIIIIVSRDGAWYSGRTSVGYATPFPWTSTVNPLFDGSAGSMGWGSGATTTNGVSKTYNNLNQGIWQVTAFDSVDHSCMTSQQVIIPGPPGTDRWVTIATGTYSFTNTPNLRSGGGPSIGTPTVAFAASQAGYYAFSFRKFVGNNAGNWTYSCPGANMPCTKIGGPTNMNFHPWWEAGYESPDFLTGTYITGKWDTMGGWSLREFQKWIAGSYVPQYRNYISTPATYGGTSAAFNPFLAATVVVGTPTSPTFFYDSGVNDYFSTNPAQIIAPCISSGFTASGNGGLMTCP